MIHVLFDQPAEQPGPVYRFRGADRREAWPMRDGACLGPAGAWNLFLRLGFRPTQVTIDSAPAGGAVLVASVTAPVAPATRQAIARWHAAGNWIIAAGDPSAVADLLPQGPAAWQYSPYPLSALGYGFDENTEIVAPPAWSFARWPQMPRGSVGQLVSIGGERQSPGRALVTPFDGAPALMVGERIVYLNANPFAAFQAWLQGQHDLAPWLEWRHRNFWLDEQVAMLWRLLAVRIPPLASAPRPGIAKLGATTIVLRHDLDSSRDTTYLDMELERGLPGNWAVLRDKNRAFWVKRLAALPGIEACFHYNSVSYPVEIAHALRSSAMRLFGRQSPLGSGYRPAVGELSRRGLRRQLEWARGHGIGIETIHRHGPFFLYPETIDALAHCFDTISELAGTGTLFHAWTLRWGVRGLDGRHGTATEVPHAGFPLWWPFRLAHAGRGGALLRGWDSTSMMECEPGVVGQWLDHRIPELPQRLFTLNYHPQHAVHPSYRPGGSAPWFAEILDMLKVRGCAIMNLRDVYRAMDAA